MLKKLLLLTGGIILLLAMAIVLGRWGRAGIGVPKTGRQQSEPIAATTWPDSGSNTPVPVGAPTARILLVGPTVVTVGQPTQTVLVQLTSSQVLSELVLEIVTGSPNLSVVDHDGAAPGIQLAPVSVPAGATVQRAEVDAAGILHFRVRDLSVSALSAPTLFQFQVQGVSAGMAPILVRHAVAYVQGGASVAVDKSTILYVQVQTAATAAIAPVPSLPGTSGEVKAGIYYRIQRGQNLYRLSKSFGVTVEALISANAIGDVRRIPTGMLLHIPAVSPTGQAAYLVAPNDTLCSIAKSFGMTVEYLGQLNGIAPPYDLAAGGYIVLRP